jgi:hypothetical protein
VSIFVGDYHILDDLLEIFVGCLNNTIHIGFVRGRIKVINLSFAVEFDNQLPIKIQSIVSY